MELVFTTKNEVDILLGLELAHQVTSRDSHRLLLLLLLHLRLRSLLRTLLLLDLRFLSELLLRWQKFLCLSVLNQIGVRILTLAVVDDIVLLHRSKIITRWCRQSAS